MVMVLPKPVTRRAVPVPQAWTQVAKVCVPVPTLCSDEPAAGQQAVVGGVLVVGADGQGNCGMSAGHKVGVLQGEAIRSRQTAEGEAGARGRVQDEEVALAAREGAAVGQRAVVRDLVAVVPARDRAARAVGDIHRAVLQGVGIGNGKRAGGQPERFMLSRAADRAAGRGRAGKYGDRAGDVLADVGHAGIVIGAAQDQIAGAPLGQSAGAGNRAAAIVNRRRIVGVDGAVALQGDVEIVGEVVGDAVELQGASAEDQRRALTQGLIAVDLQCAGLDDASGRCSSGWR